MRFDIDAVVKNDFETGNYMSDDKWILQEDHGAGVTSLTMNCAPVNALTSENLNFMASLLNNLEGDNSIKSLVINSSFKVFSAGINLKEAQDFDLDAQVAMVRGLNMVFSKLFQFSKPVIVASEGAAIAGGFFFILTSDYRVAGPKSMFGLAEVQVGVDFPLPLLEIARSMLGAGDLRRLMQSGNPIKSETALNSGIIDEIAHEGETFNRALVVAKNYSEIPPKTYAKVKRQIRGSSIDKIESLMKANYGVPDNGWYSDETKAAMKAKIK